MQLAYESLQSEMQKGADKMKMFINRKTRVLS